MTLGQFLGILHRTNELLAGLLRRHQAESHFDVAPHQAVDAVVELLHQASADQVLGKQALHGIKRRVDERDLESFTKRGLKTLAFVAVGRRHQDARHRLGIGRSDLARLLDAVLLGGVGAARELLAHGVEAHQRSEA